MNNASYEAEEITQQTHKTSPESVNFNGRLQKLLDNYNYAFVSCPESYLNNKLSNGNIPKTFYLPSSKRNKCLSINKNEVTIRTSNEVPYIDDEDDGSDADDDADDSFILSTITEEDGDTITNLSLSSSTSPASSVSPQIQPLANKIENTTGCKHDISNVVPGAVLNDALLKLNNSKKNIQIKEFTVTDSSFKPTSNNTAFKSIGYTELQIPSPTNINNIVDNHNNLGKTVIANNVADKTNNYTPISEKSIDLRKIKCLSEESILNGNCKYMNLNNNNTIIEALIDCANLNFKSSSTLLNQNVKRISNSQVQLSNGFDPNINNLSSDTISTNNSLSDYSANYHVTNHKVSVENIKDSITTDPDDLTNKTIENIRKNFEHNFIPDNVITVKDRPVLALNSQFDNKISLNEIQSETENEIKNSPPLITKKLIFQKVDVVKRNNKPIFSSSSLNKNNEKHRASLSSIASSSQYLSALSLCYDADLSANMYTSPLNSPDDNACLKNLEQAIKSMQKQVVARSANDNSYESIYSSTMCNSEYESALDIPFTHINKNKVDSISYEDINNTLKLRKNYHNDNYRFNKSLKDSTKYRSSVIEKNFANQSKKASAYPRSPQRINKPNQLTVNRLTPTTSASTQDFKTICKSPDRKEGFRVSSMPDICRKPNYKSAALTSECDQLQDQKSKPMDNLYLSIYDESNNCRLKHLEGFTSSELESIDSLQECREAPGWVSLKNVTSQDCSTVDCVNKNIAAASVSDVELTNKQNNSKLDTSILIESIQKGTPIRQDVSESDSSSSISETESSTDSSIKNFAEAGNFISSSNQQSLHSTPHKITKPKPVSAGFTPTKHNSFIASHNINITSTDLTTSFENLVDSILGVNQISYITRRKTLDTKKSTEHMCDRRLSLDARKEVLCRSAIESSTPVDNEKVKIEKHNNRSVHFKKSSSKSKTLFKECKFCVSKTK